MPSPVQASQSVNSAVFLLFLITGIVPLYGPDRNLVLSAFVRYHIVFQVLRAGICSRPEAFTSAGWC